MKYVDLTMTLDARTPLYPGDPKPEFRQVAYLKKEGWNEHRIIINTHLGTHLDVPWHMIYNGKRLGDFPIGKLIGNAAVVDVDSSGEIDANLKGIRKTSILLLRSGHSRLMHSKVFFKRKPTVSMRLAKKVVKARIGVLGIDSYSVDDPPFLVHKYLLKQVLSHNRLKY